MGQTCEVDEAVMVNVSIWGSLSHEHCLLKQIAHEAIGFHNVKMADRKCSVLAYHDVAPHM